ncbi:Fc.00g024740.m01.CDS01 [Cosmosporella sp. VM-42]
MHNPTLLTALAAVLAALPGTNAMYSKSSPVLQLNAKSYRSLIENSNYTSIVEFYAPWCGHCKNLKPVYEKAAKNLDGLAKVAAIDCDDDDNKQFCSAMGVKGFPTLKIVKPSKSGGKPVVEDYNGARTASGITDAVVRKINNHVKRITDKDIVGFLEGGDKPKAIFFSEKGQPSALLRSLALDFLDVISFGQAQTKQSEVVAKFGINTFPTLVLLPGKGKDAMIYGGEMNKKDMVAFLSQVGEPNPDPAPETKNGKAKGKANKKSKKATKAEEGKPSEPEESAETSTSQAAAEEAAPTEIPIETMNTQEELEEKCLGDKARTCILLFSPTEGSEVKVGERAIKALSALNTKYIHGKRHMFPFFSIPSESEAASTLPKKLSLDAEVNLIIVNARRGWWKWYFGDFTEHSVENWLDSVRMGEGLKRPLPKDAEVEAEESKESVADSSSTEAIQATDPEPEIETEAAEAEDETEAPEVPVEEEVTESEAEAETQTPEPEAEAAAPESKTEPEPEPEAATVEPEAEKEEKSVHDEL